MDSGFIPLRTPFAFLLHTWVTLGQAGLRELQFGLGLLQLMGNSELRMKD